MTPSEPGGIEIMYWNTTADPFTVHTVPFDETPGQMAVYDNYLLVLEGLHAIGVYDLRTFPDLEKVATLTNIPYQDIIDMYDITVSGRNLMIGQRTVGVTIHELPQSNSSAADWQKYRLN